MDKRKMHSLIAERITGWDLETDGPYPNYSGDIGQAYTVLHTLKDLHGYRHIVDSGINTFTQCVITKKPAIIMLDESDFVGQAANEALAICRAALKAVGYVGDDL